MKEIKIMVGDAIGDGYNKDVFSVTRKPVIQTQDANRSHEINFNNFFICFTIPFSFILLYLFSANNNCFFC